MAKLIYASNTSLDGCTEDERSAFDWAPPDDDVFATQMIRFLAVAGRTLKACPSERVIRPAAIPPAARIDQAPALFG